jgi:tetratricopeptide (TPR) repeat protein
MRSLLRGLLSVVALLAACSSDDEAVARHREQAAQHLAADEPEAAVLELRSALARDPESAEINFELAEAYRENGQPGRALFYYREARRLEPERLNAYLAEARILVRANPQRAREVAHELLELQPGHVEAWVLLARAALFEGDIEAALEAVRRAVKLAPESGDAHLVLGQALRAAAVEEAESPDPVLLAEALAAFERSAELSEEGESWRALTGRARVLAILPARAAEAPDAYRQALAAGKEDDARVAVAEAVLYAAGRLRDPQLRREALEVMLAADDARIAAWRELARLEAQGGGDSDAVYQRLLERRPEDAEAHTAWARHLVAQGRAEEGVAHLRSTLLDGSVEPPAMLAALVDLYFATGDRGGAREATRELEERHPDDPRTALARGQGWIADGEPAQAVQPLRQLVDTYETAAGLRLLALAEYRSGELPAASESIERAVELAPGDPAVHALRARIRYDTGEFGSALDSLRAVRRVRRLRPDERLLLARSLYETEELTAARKVLDGLITEDPPYVPAVVELARRERESEAEGVRAALERAAELAPLHPGVLRELTNLDLRAGDPEAALARLDAAIASEGVPTVLRLYRARLLLQQGRSEEAEAEALRAFDEAPGLPGLSRFLVNLYGSQGRVDEAIARLEQSRASGSLAPAAVVLLARLHSAGGDTTTARALFEEVLASGADAPRVKSDVAYLLAADGVELKRASELARQAVGALPDDPEVVNTLGFVYLREGTNEAALLHLERAVALGEERGTPRALHYHHRGLAERRVRRNRSAVESFERALELDPQFSEAERAREELAAALAGKPPS